MSDRKGRSQVGTFVAALLCLAVAALGVWMLVDSSGFMAGVDAESGRAKARLFKYSVGFLVNNLGATGTGWVLGAVGVLGLILVLRQKSK